VLKKQIAEMLHDRPLQGCGPAYPRHRFSMSTVRLSHCPNPTTNAKKQSQRQVGASVQEEKGRLRPAESEALLNRSPETCSSDHDIAESRCLIAANGLSSDLHVGGHSYAGSVTMHWNRSKAEPGAPATRKGRMAR
jgi:hypothetical protein